jgi:hypothetical protein
MMAVRTTAAHSSKDRPLSNLQADMVKQAYQAEQTYLPGQPTGQSPDDIKTEKQAAAYLQSVAQRLRGAK